MRIAQIAPLAESVPPRQYGGTERVVSWLTEELVRRGHDVTLFASGDSRTSARLVPCVPKALRPEGVRDHLSYHLMMLDQVMHQAHRFDLIHSHVDYLAFPFCDGISTPVVHTLHGRLDQPELPEIFGYFNGVNLVSISDHQRQPLPGIRFRKTVYHGLPVDQFPFSPIAEDYALFLGRISPEKDPVSAIEAAKLAGTRLLIAAKVDAADRVYFESQVEPLLDHPLIEFLGEVGDAEKSRLLSGAKALVLPIDWPEPFGVVFIEALAHGTPVITRRRGSVPEILDPGVTALFGESVEELARAIQAVDVLDRSACRREFEARFTAPRMADDYERLYRSLVSERMLPQIEESKALA